MPSGIMANLWGSSNWGYINRLEKGEIKSPVNRSIPASPNIRPLDPSPKIGGDENRKPDAGLSDLVQSSISTSTDPVSNPAPSSAVHRKAISVDAEASRSQSQFAPKPEVFPSNYPLELKTQEAQFRMLFPNVSREDKSFTCFPSHVESERATGVPWQGLCDAA
jgi:hypothetical protein